MDLGMLSSFFDNDPLYDAYTGDYLYNGQFATYDGSQLDGSFIRRRTVSLAPGLQPPPGRVVTLYGEQWVLSDPIVDGFCGEPVRQTMSARKCHAKYKILTAGQLAQGSPPGREAYAFSRWTKNTADASTTERKPYYEFSFSRTEATVEGLFIQDGEKVWHARMSTEVSEGFTFAEADELTPAFQDKAKVQAGRLQSDPVTLQEVVIKTYSAAMFERYQFFKKTDQAQPKNYFGDKTLVISKADEANLPDLSEMSFEVERQDGTKSRWMGVAVQDLGDGWAVHIREV